MRVPDRERGAALLTVPLEVTDRVALSLVVGPLVGASVHLGRLATFST